MSPNFTCITLISIRLATRELQGPDGGRRRGVLGMDVARGHPLAIAQLGSAFVDIAAPRIARPPVWAPLRIPVVHGADAFRWT